MYKTLATLLLLIPLSSLAGPLEYVCKIKNEQHLGDDGSLQPYSRPLYIGNTFNIDRRTGRTIGQPFSNSTARKIEVVTQGTENRNFEVLSASSPDGQAVTHLLIVREWVKGVDKPFIGLSSGDVFSGTCR